MTPRKRASRSALKLFVLALAAGIVTGVLVLLVAGCGTTAPPDRVRLCQYSDPNRCAAHYVHEEIRLRRLDDGRLERQIRHEREMDRLRERRER